MMTMKNAFDALYKVAEELAETAKQKMPRLRDGETTDREYLSDGVYYRETSINGEKYRAGYDFRRKTAFFI